MWLLFGGKYSFPVIAYDGWDPKPTYNITLASNPIGRVSCLVRNRLCHSKDSWPLVWLSLLIESRASLISEGASAGWKY
jgi:hypothetical protein